ncbi:MAG: TetR/AcrR family transcriptional regulator [Myxococcales bacterium]|nr:TetR/AcrR family transcriptional regulator [Myxococcales bacterium]
MRYDAEHKDRTRARILEQAAASFRREGYRGVGIDRIMAAARLTRGGFYAHFRSKAALFAEVLGLEADFVRRLRQARGAAPTGSPGSAAAVIRGYLAPENRERVAAGCTLATLTNDAARADDAARTAYASLVEDLARELEKHVRPGDTAAREAALEALALCVGGIGLARGIGDEALAREVLAVCADRACAALEGRAPR